MIMFAASTHFVVRFCAVCGLSQERLLLCTVQHGMTSHPHTHTHTPYPHTHTHTHSLPTHPHSLPIHTHPPTLPTHTHTHTHPHSLPTHTHPAYTHTVWMDPPHHVHAWITSVSCHPERLYFRLLVPPARFHGNLQRHHGLCVW